MAVTASNSASRGGRFASFGFESRIGRGALCNGRRREGITIGLEVATDIGGLVSTDRSVLGCLVGPFRGDGLLERLWGLREDDVRGDERMYERGTIILSKPDRRRLPEPDTWRWA